MNAERKLMLYIAMSIDGYIAGPDEDLSFLSTVQKEGEDYGYGAFIETIDTVILGRKTYEWVMTQVNYFPHADKETYVITRTPRPAIGSVQFYNGELKTLVNNLKSRPGKNIFCDGGAEVVNTLLKEALIDEMIISIIPVLLHGGTRLFLLQDAMQQLILLRCQAYEKGLVQLHYKVDKVNT